MDNCLLASRSDPKTLTERFNNFSVPWSTSSAGRQQHPSHAWSQWSHHKWAVDTKASSLLLNTTGDANGLSLALKPSGMCPHHKLTLSPKEGSLIQTGRESASTDCHLVNNSASLLISKTSLFGLVSDLKKSPFAWWLPHLLSPASLSIGLTQDDTSPCHPDLTLHFHRFSLALP